MPIANQMIKMVEGMKMVKKMFEEGGRLKAEHGPDNVFDFSLGNPDVPPPPEFKKVLKELVNDESWGTAIRLIPDTLTSGRRSPIISAPYTMSKSHRI